MRAYVSLSKRERMASSLLVMTYLMTVAQSSSVQLIEE